MRDTRLRYDTAYHTFLHASVIRRVISLHLSGLPLGQEIAAEYDDKSK